MDLAHMRIITLKSKGFTFVELIVVIILISILAFYAIPVGLNPYINLDSTVQSIVSDIRYAQMLAMSHNRRFGIYGTATTMQVVNSTETTAGSGIGTAIALPYGGTTHVLPAGYMVSGTGGQITSFVSFDNFGVPYYSSSVAVPGNPLTANGYLYLSGPSGMVMTITITPYTGAISYQ
jgi:prepilin-type N-terminal cleavage/methylation domain-containing protein